MMSHVDFGRYKRIVQYFWDPEPRNDDESKSPVWCLGTRYDSPSKPIETSSTLAEKAKVDKNTICDVEISKQAPRRAISTSQNGVQAGSSAVLDRDEGDRDWPKGFLDDFESRLSFTYRSNFSAIKKSPDPKSSNAIALAVRLRSQLVDHGEFTSDTGWGCMIRSGQSLLANALIMLRLGRGMQYRLTLY